MTFAVSIVDHSNVERNLCGPGAFRFLLAAVVVIHHSFPLRMGAWAVYVFFVLSGYWIATMWDRKYQHTRLPVVTFLVSRWWRLAPVLIVCTVLAIWLGGLRPTGGLSLNWFIRQFLIVGSVSAGHLLPPAWSLDVEAQFYLLAPLILWMVSKQRSIVLFLAMAFGFACFFYSGCCPSEPGHWILQMGVVPYLGFFLSGTAIYRWAWVPSKAYAVVSMLLFVSITTLLVVIPQTRSGIWASGAEASYQWWHQLWAGGGALMVLPFVAGNVRQKGGSWDRQLGNWAYPLYVFHWLPRNWYYNHVSWTEPLSKQLIFLAADFLAALIGSFLILMLLDSPIDRLRARWVESRVRPRLSTVPDASSLVTWTGSSRP